MTNNIFYGIIIQSTSRPSEFRQTLVLPNLNDQSATTGNVYFSRIITEGAQRSRWVAGYPDTGIDQVCGAPVVLEFTEVDINNLRETGTPTNFGQKADRKVASQTARTDVRLSDLLQSIVDAEAVPFDWKHLFGRGMTAPAPQVSPVVTAIAGKSAEQHRPAVRSVQVATSVDDLSLHVPDLADPRVSGYVNRNVGGVTDGRWAEIALKQGRNLAINGEAGTGKTSFGRWLSAKRGVPFVVVPCSPQTDALDVQGGFNPTEDGTLEWTYSQFAQAFQQPSVILLNESSRMKAGQNAYFLSALEEGIIVCTTHKGEVLKKHPECLIITDYNSGYAGTTSHDEAFLDRFGIKVTFDYDIELERNFIKSESLLELAQKVRAQREDVFTHTPFSTRLLKYFQEQALELGNIEGAVYVLLQSFVDPIERSALKTLIEGYRFNIADELGVTA